MLSMVMAGATGEATGTTAPIESLYQIRHWSRQTGLPGNRVRALAHTPDGHLWIGTEAGLARFDGISFHRFHRGNTPLFTDDDLSSMTCIGEDQLWVTLGRSVVVMKQGRSIERLPTIQGVPWAREGLARGRHGRAWVRADQGWIGWSLGQSQPDAQSALPPSLAIHEDVTGCVWSVDAGRLTAFPEGAKGSAKSFALMVEGHPAEIRAAFVEGTNSLRLLYGSVNPARSLGLFLLGPDGPEEQLSDLPANGMSPLSPLVDGQGSLWYAAGKGFLGRVREGRFVRFTLGSWREHPVSLVGDYEGNLWVGLEHSGLLQLRPRVMSSWTPSEGLPDAQVRALEPRAESGIWIGTDQGVRAMAGDGAWLGPTHLADHSVRALLTAPEDVLWMGTARGLFWLRGSEVAPVPLPKAIDPSDAAGLGSLKIRAIVGSRDDDVWVLSGKMVTRFGAGSNEGRAVAVLSEHGPNAAIEDRAGHWWIATGKGVAVFERDTVQQADWLRMPRRGDDELLRGSRWFLEPDVLLTAANGLSSDHAWEVFEDRKGAIWIACDNGLNLLPAGLPTALRTREKTRVSGDSERKASDLAVFTRAHGLPDHQVNALVEDRLGHLWCGTDHGIYCVPRTDFDEVARGQRDRLRATLLTSADGLPTDEVSGRISHPTAREGRDGHLWFATAKGLVAFDPGAVLESLPEPRVALVQVLADERPIFSTLPGDELDESIVAAAAAEVPAKAGRLRLPPGRGRVLVFQFTAPAYTSPHNCRFRYRMIGYDKDGVWHEAGTRRTAIFTNLDPGRYRFEVQVAHHRHTWSSEAATFAFVLSPFVWQTTTFRVVLAGAAMLAVYWVTAWRIREVRRVARLEHQNSMLRERASIARDIHDDLGPRLTQLALLTSSGAVGDKAIADGKGDGNAARLGELARDLAHSLDGALWTVEPSGDNLAGFVDYLVDFAADFLQPAGIALRWEVPDRIPCQPLPRAMKRHLFLLVKEALNNVVRHANARSVNLQFHVDPSRFILELSDDGRGFRWEGESNDSGDGPRHHLGLRSMQERANALGGHLEIRSVPGRGTVLRLLVPFAGADAAKDGRR